MPHPLSSDPVMGKFFRRAKCQIVRRFADGSEGKVTFLSTSQAERELPKYRERIGYMFDGLEGPTKLLDVELVPIS